MDEWRAALAAMEAGNFTPPDITTKKTNDRYVLIKIINVLRRYSTYELLNLLSLPCKL